MSSFSNLLQNSLTSMLPLPNHRRFQQPPKFKVQHIQLNDPRPSSTELQMLKYQNSCFLSKTRQGCNFAGFYKTTRFGRTTGKSAEFEREMDHFYSSRELKSKEFVQDGNVRRFALTSRLIVLFIQILGASVIPKHENDGFRTPKDNVGVNGTFLDAVVNTTLSGFVNWDGEYYLHIATNGYTHENAIAFFPLFPAIVGLISTVFYTVLYPIISFQSITLVVGWLFNTWCFQESAVDLNKLVSHLDRGLHNLNSYVLYLFCYNPASIFFSSFYSESLFAYTTINVLLALYERKLVKSITFASLGLICRSNGLLNFGFIGAFLLRDLLSVGKKDYALIQQKIGIGYNFAIVLLYSACGLVPFALFQIYCSWKFCGKNLHVPPREALKLCNFEQLPYMYIQSKNWNVGFLRYFEVAQIPNFLLAAPVLWNLGFESYKRVYFYGKCVLKYKIPATLPDLAMGMHGIFLTLFCLFFIHVQVSTRMIMSSCPYLYIYIAKSLRTELCRIRAREIMWLPYSFTIQTWFCAYFVIGTLAFSRGYPWT